MTKEQFSDFFRSRFFIGIIAGICIMIVVICIFEAGVFVGYREASFSEHWGANYSTNFAGSNTTGLPDAHIPNPNGILGKIVSISPNASGTSTLVISNTQNPEEKILIGSDTIIRERENTVSLASLSVGTYAVVLGMPNDQGEIEAKLIRIVPEPSSLLGAPSGTAPSTTSANQ